METPVFEDTEVFARAVGESTDIVQKEMYYPRTVFEFESERLGAQAALGGGGRYDGLIEEPGGPPTPGVGFAAGIERILPAAGEQPAERPRTVFVVHQADDLRPLAFQLGLMLREAGFRVESEQAGRSLKGQMRHADRLGAFVAVILGDGIEVKDMETGEQHEAPDPDAVLRLVREAAEAAKGH